MLNFKQTQNLIETIGTHQTVIVEGQPGIGKTQMAKALAKAKGIPCVVVDCATMVDGGDITIPWMLGDSFKHVPNAMFGVTEQVPMVICFDEIGKANKSVIAAITPALRDHKIAGIQLPLGSIVYGTSNNVADRVGDNIPAHIWNGVTAVQLRNPTTEEWIYDYALHNGVAGEVIAWVQDNPQVFEHYTDNKKHEDNPMIFDPRDPARRQYVTPRSLDRVSRIIHDRHSLSEGVLLDAVGGTIGLPAAHSLITLATLADKLPAYDDVVSKPTKVKVPVRGVAQIISATNLGIKASQKTGTNAHRQAVARYVARLEPEVQALFTHQMFSGPNAALWVVCNAAFTQLTASVGNIM